jgi:3-oxoacyl-[acyl-carrier-protein] synthase III
MKTPAAPAIYLRGISHHCGPRTSLEELPALRDDPEALKYLTTLGLRRFSRIAEPTTPLIERCADETMRAAGTVGADIDAVITFSTLLDPHRELDNVALVAAKLGIVGAQSFGVFHNQCTNYSQALQLARYLTICEPYRHVLLIGWDVLDERRGDRIMPNRLSVYSDVVLTAMVSRDAHDGFRIDGISHRYLPDISGLQAPGEVLRFIQRYSDGLRGACQSLYQAVDASPGVFKRMITANYNLSVLRNLAELAGVRQDRVFTDNLADYAHCFAADQLISLEQLSRRGECASGDRLLLVGAGGSVVFGAVAVTMV